MEDQVDNDPMTIGQKIKRYRLINDIRQEDMAEKMGVSRATLINYEKGHTAINFDVLERFRNAYPDFTIDNKELCGTVLMYEGKIIHFSCFSKKMREEL